MCIIIYSFYLNHIINAQFQCFCFCNPLSNVSEDKKPAEEKLALDELKKKFENKEVSTADFVKSLSNEVLTEEAKGDWFASYLKPAQDNGLLKGINFDLSKKNSREEIAQLAYNFAKRGSEAKAKENKPVSFKDEKSIGKNYLEAITCLYNKEVLKG